MLLIKALQKQFLNAVKDGDVTKVTHLLKVSAKAQAAGSPPAASGVPTGPATPASPTGAVSPPAKTRPSASSSSAAGGSVPDNEIIDLGFESIDKFTALHFACRKGSLDIVKLLLQQQPPPDVNALTKQNWSSLMLACMRGMSLIRLIIHSLLHAV
jgi:hypothetical protein